MKVGILSRNSETATRIAKSWGVDHFSGKPDKFYDVIINYGSGASCAGTYRSILNDPERVEINSRNKGMSLMILSDAGVSTAEIYTPKEIVESLMLPCVGRQSQHVSGKNFYLCLTEKDIFDALVEGADHFQSFLDIREEYRVHMVGHTPFLLQEKVKRISSQSSMLQKYVRTRSNGWDFVDKVFYGTGFPRQAIHESIHAMMALGLDFGSVDIGIDKDGRAYVFEVNTGTRLGDGHIPNFIAAMEKEIQLLEEKRIGIRGPLQDVQPAQH